MSDLQFDIQTPGWEDHLRKLARFDKIWNKHFLRAMKKSTITAVSEVTPLVPVGVGARLKNSMGSEIEEDAGSIIGKFGSSLKGEEYPSVQNFGRRPGAKMPPLEPLIRWVHVKKLAGSYSVSTRRRLGGKKTQEQQDHDLAFMIARKIKARGIKGKHFMERGFERAKSRILEYFRQAAEDVLKDLTQK